MKRICCLVAMAILIFVNISVYAEKKEYRINEAEMTISIPSDWYVFTRDMPADDPLFNKISYKYEELMPMLEKLNSYLFCVLPDNSAVVGVSVSPPLFTTDLKDLSAGNLNVLRAGLGTYISNGGGMLKECEVFYDNPQTCFYEGYVEAKDGSYKGMVYFTEVNRLDISINQIKYNSDVTDADKAVLRDIVSSIKLDHVNEAKEEATPEAQTPVAEAEEYQYDKASVSAIIGGVSGALFFGVIGLVILIIKKKK